MTSHLPRAGLNAYLLLQDAFNDPNAFTHFFDQTPQFNSNAIIPPPASPPQSIHRPSISHVLPYDSSSSLPNDGSVDQEYDQAPGRGSSDEDKDNLTPAQSRRKAQNRAAYVPHRASCELSY